ncbi:MAG: hypothetical protein V4550_12335 [Gemmatimonadota bacterium]
MRWGRLTVGYEIKLLANSIPARGSEHGDWASGVCFHIIPTIATRQLSPGLGTAIGLYLPFSSLAFVSAARDGVSRQLLVPAGSVGTVVACAVVLCRAAAVRYC